MTATPVDTQSAAVRRLAVIAATVAVFLLVVWPRVAAAPGWAVGQVAGAFEEPAAGDPPPADPTTTEIPTETPDDGGRFDINGAVEDLFDRLDEEVQES